MVTIYGVYRSRASRNLWLAGEIGLPVEHVPVTQAYRLPNPDAADAPVHTRSAAFLAVNPNGRIPAMKDGELVLCESLAINLYLAKKYGGALGPRDVPEDALMTQWAIWAMTEAEPHTIQILYNATGNPNADASKRDAAIGALRQPLAVLDAALAKDGFLVGGRFTVADINTAEVIRYAAPAAALFDAAPHVKAWLAACHARPAFKAMMAAREQEPA